MRKLLTFAAVGATALMTSAAFAPSVFAQSTPRTTLNSTPTYNSGPSTDPGAAANQAESRNYDQMTRSNPAFRNQRLQRECGSIEAADLRQQCADSFGQQAGIASERSMSQDGNRKTTSKSATSTTRRNGASTMSGSTGTNRSTLGMGASSAPGQRPMSTEVQGQSSTGIGSQLPQTNFGGNKNNSNNR